METREYRTIDKSDWEPGPWHEEPDKRQWADEDTGMPCLMVRNGSGALCGYVGVPKGHPLFKVEGDNYEEMSSLSVHGGITFTASCADTPDEGSHICHVPGEGESDNIWWLGFDCSHSGDLCPKYTKIFKNMDCAMPPDYETYKPMSYVIAECARLAQQLQTITSEG